MNGAGVELDSEDHLPLCGSAPPVIALHLQIRSGMREYIQGECLRVMSKQRIITFLLTRSQFVLINVDSVCVAAMATICTAMSTNLTVVSSPRDTAHVCYLQMSKSLSGLKIINRFFFLLKTKFATDSKF